MAVDLTQLSNLSRESALDLIGQETTCSRKIIGVTGSPNSGYPRGLYLTVASRFAKSEHVRVGDNPDATAEVSGQES
jgi:hypothetical protein